MATFQITGPDGKKYRVSGENAEGALQALQSHLGTPQDGSQAQAQAAPSPQMQQGMGELSAFTQNPDQANADRAQFDALPGWKKPLVAASDIAGLAATGLTGGLVNAAAAGVRAPFTDKTYSEELAALTAADDRARNRAGSAGLTAEIGSSVLGLGKLAGAGVTTGRLLPQGAGLLGRTGASVADSLLINEAMNAGYGRDFGENAGLAAGMGAAAPAITAGLSKAVDLGKAAFGYGNEPRAKKAIIEALMRSGKSADDIATDMLQAVDDGQGVYTLADALGDPGQRMLSGVARSPGDMRATIADTLASRQAGQGDRLTNALVEGFDAPKTAAQMEKALTDSRRAAGAANYGAARQAAGAVDTSGAIQAIDDIVSPGLTPMVGTGAADNGVYATLKKARSFLTDGKATVADFDRALMAKQEMDAIIEAGGTTANLLRPARNALDDALSQASAPYAKARDAYRQGSKAIEAVDTGKTAASGRVRSQDSIPQFKGLSPQEQAAFRTGYVDPMIAKLQAQGGEATNKARPLLSDKTGLEFPAFAAQGQADQLGRRLAREQTMFKTANAALGGSKTADNIQDALEMGGIDPSMIMNALGGNWKQTALAAAGNFAAGRNSPTRDLIAKALLATGKEGSAQVAKAIKSTESLTKAREMIAKMLLGGGLSMLPAN